MLERRHDAWSRLLATFRGIFGGIEHEALRLPALGGSLFDPDRFPFLEGRGPQTKWREQPAVPLPIDNRTVLLLMTALQILEQKGGAQLLSYRALDVEQIGHVYEGLLEFTAARVPEITLGLIGTKKLPNSQITLSELDSIAAKGEEALLEHLKELTGRSLPALGKALKAEESCEMLVRLVQASNGDEALARRLLPFGELIRADSWGNLLVYRQGSFAIVKGTDRRSSGTHYTPRSLTEPIVRYTLEPLVYVGPAEGHSQSAWKLKSSADILALNVCDMACGSGAFLVEACRYLSLRLVEAWANDEARGLQVGIDGIARETLGNHEPLPKPLDDRLLVARRLVAQSCLYGVDINHLAVELAKLAIWLVALAKNKPFSFLDHALRCGDSLVGLHDLEQLRFYNLKPDAENPLLFKGPLNTAVDEAIELRVKLEGKPADTVADVEAQGRLLAQAEDDVARLKCSADLLVAAEFWGENNADKLERTRQAAVKSAYYVEKGPTNEFEQIAAKERRGQTMFHWPLEFPEVIVKRGGFDAFICNPPFMGGKTISGHLGDEYLAYLKNLWNHQKGSADYAAYFFLQAFSEMCFSGNLGMISTNSIAQGDTRAVGLDFIESQGGCIYRAENNRPWPGLAAVVVNVLHISKSKTDGEHVLDGRKVNYISTLLDEQGQMLDPERLFSNRDVAFQGTIVHGEGFILEPAEAERLIHSDAKNADVVFPYLDGQDLNSRPDQTPSRWIINFRDWPIDKANTFPECLSILTKRVKPCRDEVVRRGKQIHEYDYWKFWDKRLESYERLNGLSRVLVVAQTSRTLAFAFVPNGYVYSMMTIVFPFQDASVFAVLQSCFHELWARRYSSTMKEDLRYTPSQVFETFPLPFDPQHCEGSGEAYHVLRQGIMLDRQEGLTKTYNHFHDPDDNSTDIKKLRELHVEMDEAVAAAYGCSDLDLDHGFHETKQGIRFTISEAARRVVLQQLLKLNHERHEEESRQLPQGKTNRSRSRKKQKTDLGDLPLLDTEGA